MTILRMMILGLLFSLSASYTVIAVFNPGVTFTSEELFYQFIIAAILGPVIGVGSLIFYIEKLTLFWQLFVHFIFVTASVLVAGRFGNWYGDGSFLSLGKLLFIQVIIYIVIWIILNLIAQRDIAKINEKLQRKQEKKE